MENMKRLLEYRRPGTGELITFRTRQYYVTDTGQVWNDELKRFMPLRENQGYLVVNLRGDDGKCHNAIGVHCLVASCFIRLLEKGVNVHHINHVKSDNRLENLKIIDAKEHVRQHDYEKWTSGRMDGNSAKMKKAWKDGCFVNMPSKVSAKIRKAWQDGRFDGVREKAAAKLINVGTKNSPAKKVVQLDKDGQVINVWPSTAECGRSGFDQGNVSRCCRNCFNRPGNNVYKGYRWMWYEDFQKEQNKEASHLEQLASS